VVFLGYFQVCTLDFSIGGFGGELQDLIVGGVDVAAAEVVLEKGEVSSVLVVVVVVAWQCWWEWVRDTWKSRSGKGAACSV
jgi:hypothetical protein